MHACVRPIRALCVPERPLDYRASPRESLLDGSAPPLTLCRPGKGLLFFLSVASVTIDQQGWTAEMWIPFTQLRFNEGREPIWGLNIHRWIPSKNEDDYWVAVPRTEVFWASRFGELRGPAEVRDMRSGLRGTGKGRSPPRRRQLRLPILHLRQAHVSVPRGRSGPLSQRPASGRRRQRSADESCRDLRPACDRRR